MSRSKRSVAIGALAIGTGLLGAGNAQAAGQIGAANANAQGLSGVASAGNNLSQYYMLNNLLNSTNSATGGNYTGADSWKDVA